MRAGMAALPLDRFRLAIEACDRFEAAWRTGDRPPVERFLGDFEGPEREIVRGELLALAGEFAEKVPSDEAIGPPEPRASGSPPGWIGGFEILGILGRGGMGVVYRARHRVVGRVVALKVIRPGLSDEFDPEQFNSVVSRFLAEARTAGGIQHDHIVEVYEAGRWEGRYYYAMRPIEGRTFAEVIRGGPIPGREAASVVEPIARAVDFAHREGVIHRDLKPRNILVDEAGRPFVADFGLAKVLGGDEGHTRTGELLGSPPYMAPEQVRDPARVGPAADVYALGATLYEAVTGRPPFRAAGLAETLRQVVEEPVPRPRDLNPAVPRDLETICLKCLEKEPGRRHASAGDLAEDLRRFLGGRPILARPVGAAERLARWARRDPRAAALAAACLVVTLGLLGTWARSVGRDREHAMSLLLAERRHAEEQSASARQARRGISRRAASSWRRSGATTRRSGRSPSTPRGDASPRGPAARSCSGTSRPAARSPGSTGTPAGSTDWPSPATAAPCSPSAPTGPCGSGGPGRPAIDRPPGPDRPGDGRSTFLLEVSTRGAIPMTCLFLLRHGLAVPHGAPGIEDDDRPLTTEGERRVRVIGRGLRRLKVQVARIATSPLPRALKTAQIVAQELGEPGLVEVADELRAGRDASSIRAWLATRQEPRLMVVGHNPSLSALLALLTTGDENHAYCELRKGGVASLVGDPRGLYAVDWIARPKMFLL